MHRLADTAVTELSIEDLEPVVGGIIIVCGFH